MRVPFSWLPEYCDPGLGPEEVADLLSMRAVEVERVSRVGVPATEGFVVGRVRRRPSSTRTPTGCASARSRPATGCGRSSAAPPTSPPSRRSRLRCPARCCPTGSELGRAKLRGVESDGMILSEQRAGAGSDDHDRGSWSSTSDEAAPGTPLDHVLPISESVLELDLNPNRVDCMGVYGVAREVHAITGAPLRRPALGGRRRARRAPAASRSSPSVTVEVPELCPRFTARAFTGSQPRALARLAARAPDRRRDAADLQRRRHHQLRDADDGAASARLRPRPRAAAAS